jgi:oligopeptide/dipeptide ABC transporter ATP-binding protein
MDGTILEVKDLKTHFFTHEGVVRAVDGVSFYVNRGETIALVGESGCGKTVTSLSILRLVASPPGKIIGGQIIFEGTDLLKLSKDDMRKIRGVKIAMIFQEPLTSLNPVLTVGRQLTESLEYHLNMNKKQSREEAINLLKQVGIPHPESRIDDYPHRFSGGMRQRVMIAMAISCKPHLIIADEPTTVVDVTIQAQLLELIKGLTKTLGTSLILITHNLGIVARYAQRVYVMYAGHIIEHGPALEVYHHPAHPYTAGLLTSVPRLDEPRKTRLTSIEGQPPDLLNAPATCAFEPRCECCNGECKDTAPALVEVGKGHFAACRLSEERPWAQITKQL